MRPRWGDFGRPLQTETIALVITKAPATQRIIRTVRDLLRGSAS